MQDANMRLTSYELATTVHAHEKQVTTHNSMQETYFKICSKQAGRSLASQQFCY